jgi:hypothetical protein
MTSEDTKKIRDRTWYYLSDEVAAVAGLSLAGLQQFVAGTVTLDDEQLTRLARRMGMTLHPIAPMEA